MNSCFFIFFCLNKKKKTKLSVTFPVLHFRIWHKIWQFLVPMVLGTPRKYTANIQEAPWNFMLISCPLLFQSFQSFLQLPIQLRGKCFVFLELYLYFLLYYYNKSGRVIIMVIIASRNLSACTRAGLVASLFSRGITNFEVIAGC